MMFTSNSTTQIGIIDTGTDYTHPYLGGGFGNGFKVAGGYDFVGDGWYPTQFHTKRG
jgi:subtilisin family serine protease